MTTAAVSPLTYPVLVSVKVGSGGGEGAGGVNGLDGEGWRGVTVIWAVAVCPA